MPNVSFHVKGEIIGNDYETSKDTHGLTEPAEYWTEEEVRELKETLAGYMEQVVKEKKDPLRIEFYYENVCASCEGDADFYALYNRCISPEEKAGLDVETATYNVFMDSCRERYEEQAGRLGISGTSGLPGMGRWRSRCTGFWWRKEAAEAVTEKHHIFNRKALCRNSFISEFRHF